MVKISKYFIILMNLNLVSCFPSLDRNPLEILNTFIFFQNLNSQSNRSLVNGEVGILLYSKAYGEISIQNLNDPVVTISENGETTIPVLSSRGNGTLDFRITTQPTDHDCRIVNPEEPYVAGSTAIEINCFSLLSTSPISGGIIPPLDSIVFRFSDSVDFDPTNMSDNSFTDVNLESPGNPDFVLSNTLVANDTLTVTAPAPGWSPGVGKFVGFNFRNLQGKNFASGAKRLNLTVASAIRYVSPSGADFVNDGLTPSTPFRNIQRAIDVMDPCPDKACLVLVEAGNYNAAEFGVSIFMKDGISILGSYVTGTNFGNRNPSLRNSVISMPFGSANCGDISPNCTAVRIEDVNVPTILEGFHIESYPSRFTYAAEVIRSNLTINNVRFRSGNGDFMNGLTVGLYLENSNSNILNSTIETGICNASNVATYGVFLFADNSLATPMNPRFLNSTIQSGDCMGPSGISIGLRYTSNMNNVELTQFQNTPIQSGNATSQTIGIEAVTALAMEGIHNITTGTASFRNTGLDIVTDSTVLIQNTNIQLGNSQNTGTGNAEAFGMNLNTVGVLTLIGNSINMGNVNSNVANSTAFGIRIFNSNNFSSISRNTVRMANLNSGSLTGNNFGITWNGASSGNILNNIVYAGSTNRNAIGISILNNGQNLKVFHNTVAMGSTTGDPSKSSSFDYGGTGNSGTMELRNNIFLNSPGTETCVSTIGIPTGAIQGNAFWNCDTLILNTDVGGLDYPDICNPNGEVGRNSCASPPGDFTGNGANFEGNLKMNPGLNPLNGQLTNSSPCVIALSNNFLPTVFNDRFMNPRNPPTVSLGAVEHMGSCIP